MEETLKHYPVIIEIPVAWGDMDAFGHVNNVVFHRYFESSRVAYLEKIELWKYMKKSNIGPILKSSRCSYKIPLTYPDTLSVASRIISIETDRFLMEHMLYSHKLKKIAAEGDGIIVIYDYSNNTKAPVPDHIRENISKLDKL